MSTATEMGSECEDSLHLDTYSAGTVRQYAPAPLSLSEEPERWSGDGVDLPTLTADGRVMPISHYPFYHFSWGGWNTWNLHEGFNASLSASVFAQFGKGAHHGAGFAQSLSAMYALPLSQKLSLAVGGYVNQFVWSRDVIREAGLTAVMGYRFNEHWEAYLYGQKSLTENRQIPYPLYDMGLLGDRIGAGVQYIFSPSFRIGFSVEHQSMPNRDNFHDTYMKGVPPPPVLRQR